MRTAPPTVLFYAACVAAACLAPRASAQTYAVPAGEPVVLDGGPAGGTNYGGIGDGGIVYGETILDGNAYGGEPVYGEPVFEGQTYDRSATAGLPPGMEVIGGPGMAGHGGTGSQTAYLPPGRNYPSPQILPGGCDGACGPGCDDTAGYGPAYGEPVLGGTVCGAAYGCDTGCGTGCDATCQPACGAGGCGGPVVCNKFGRCGKFYNAASRRTRCGLSAGYGFLFLRPRLDTASAAVIRTPTSRGTFTRAEDFDFDLESGARIYVELIRPDAWGFRVTWAGLDADSNALLSTVPDGGSISSAGTPSRYSPFTVNPAGALLLTGDGDRLRTQYNVEFDVFDIESTRRFKAGRWLLNAGGGIRFATLEQTYDAVSSGSTPGSATAANDFDGAGTTLFAEFRRPIGQSGFAFLTSVRGSVIYGDRDGSARTSQAGVVDTGKFSTQDLVPITEAQLGGEWSAWVNPNTLFFTQVAFETQLWSGVGTAHDPEGDVGFSGFNITMGLEW